MPHYDSEKDRRPSYQRYIVQGDIKPGYAGDDCVAFHYIDTQLYKIVSSKAEAKAYKLEQHNGEARESVIQPEFLG